MAVVIDPYDPAWPELFRQTALPMRAALGPVALRIDHIGSTALPHASAKPIIDIQISIPSFHVFANVLAGMQHLGYDWEADNPDRTKRYFREPPAMRRTHVHVRCAGSWSEQFNLLFRDYLRGHPADVEAYSALKMKLAIQYGDDREGYTEAKSPFIWQVMMRAHRWSQETGWQPGPTDV